MTIGIYAGSFDPITNGHLDIIKRSMQFCDELVVAIGVNPDKKTMFSEEDREKQVSFALYSLYKENDFFKISAVKIESFQGLLVDYAKTLDASVLIRGIRSVSDFEYEINLANINKVLAPKIETVFLPTSPELTIVSSSMVKEVARLGGDINRFVPKHVAEAVNKKFGFIKLSDPEK
jgi:pantetheine-phosphate adenylyltransferase